MQRQLCPNLNHSRVTPPVRYCPECGNVVNADIIVTKCSEEDHAKSRRNRNKYCAGCGAQLVK